MTQTMGNAHKNEVIEVEWKDHVRRIDLRTIRHNIECIRKQVPDCAQLMAVVKADAYGHGMVQVAQTAKEAGVFALAVATVEEGVRLRKAGLQGVILVLGLAPVDEMEMAVCHQLTLSVCTTDGIENLQRVAEPLHQIAMVHMKIDTGMNRIGVRTEDEVRQMLEALSNAPQLQLTGAFTHFADADGEDLAFTHAQLERFRQLTALLPKEILRHCANSAAIHRLMPEAAMDMVRMGISMYGYPPVPTTMDLRPAMAWESYVTFVKDIGVGDTVSYGRTFQAERPMRIATVQCGYGDGYHRAASPHAYVLLHGRRARVLGRICMDQMMVDVTAIADVRPGDRVTLMGTDGDETITAEDIALWAGTIPYEVLLSSTGRVNRIWEKDDGKDGQLWKA